MKNKNVDENRDRAFGRLNNDIDALIKLSSDRLNGVANETDAENRKAMLVNALSEHKDLRFNLYLDMIEAHNTCRKDRFKEGFNLGGIIGSLVGIGGSVSTMIFLKKKK